MSCRQKRIPGVVLGLLSLLAFSLGGMAAPLEVFVSLPPMAEAVEAIGGAQVSVKVLLPAGVSPETYQPDARMLEALGRSQALFTMGAPFEETLLPRLRRAFPRLLLADGAAGMERRNFPEGGEDPHVWLSVANMLRYADNVCQALCGMVPEAAGEFQTRCREYRERLEETGRLLAERLAPLKGRSVLVYHPAFGYFLGQFGIEQIAIEEEGKEPSGRSLMESLARARELGLPAIFVQPQFSPRSAKVLAQELKARVIPLDPLPARLSPGLREMAETIANAYCPSL
ncbi:MAG: metal ABC transporter solute-binding protein, Zn/Mn family [Oligosphaeraceae bacterium]